MRLILRVFLFSFAGGGDMSQPSDANESPFGLTPKISTLQTPREGDSPFVQGEHVQVCCMGMRMILK